MKILLTVPLTSYIHMPPKIPDLGLGYIASSLKTKGHEVIIRDWNMDPSPENFRESLNAFKPDIVGVKIFTKDVGAAKKTVSHVRAALGSAKIVVGGPHPSASDPVELMRDFADIDYAIRGEAEESLPALIEALSAGPDPVFRKVHGLVWREDEDIRFNPVAFNFDLDKIAHPCWDMQDPKNYQVGMHGSMLTQGYTAPIITTRGCPGKCTYCSAFNVNGRRIRARSPENVLVEMALLYEKYGVRKFMFLDNCFTANKDNLLGICNGIIKRGMKIEWDFVSFERLDNLTDETLSVMYRAGARMILMGIESGTEKIRRVMNKSCSLDDISSKIKILKRNGIKVGAYFMLGFPGETRSDIRETVDYAFSLKADLVTFTPCFPLPGSDVYDYIKKKHGFDRIDWASFDIERSPYPISELSSSDLTRVLKTIRLRLRMGKALSRVKRLFGQA